jgi:hypothetical protein
MALSKLQVTQCIAAVRQDKDASWRINSIFSVMGKQSGVTRNYLMAFSNVVETLGRGVTRGITAVASVGSSEVSRWSTDRAFKQAGLKSPNDQPLLFDPNLDSSLGAELQCTGIAEAAQAAIEQRQQISKNFVPDLKKVSCHSRSEGYAHMGVVLTMKDDTNYVLDWWATLDIANPLVYKFDDFDMNRKDAAREYAQFGGFS